MTELTQDGLLGGRVVLTQPRARGLRAGLDAVLLAAAVPARPGERVIEAGCGSGAAFLCLGARVPDLAILAVEREAAMASLAAENAVANGCHARVVTGTVADLALAQQLGRARHGFANPPYWPGGTAPPDPLRARATHAGAVTLDDWARFLAATVDAGGTGTLILPAARYDAAVSALRGAGFGGIALLPLVPRAGEAAKRVLLQGRRSGRGPARVAPAFVLHAADGTYTPAAEAVLRGAEALRF